MKDLMRLFITFFKIGLFRFGGGYAMISLIERDVVVKRKWMTREDMMNIVTIAEATPGPISVNTATFVGTKVKGVLGAFFATLGLVLPSFFIIVAVSLVLNEVKDIKLVNYALRGIQACVVVLICNAFVKFFKAMEKSPIPIVLFIGAFAVSFFTGFNVIFIILIGAGFGLALTVINVVRSNKIKKKESAADKEGEDCGGDLENCENNGEKDASATEKTQSGVEEDTSCGDSAINEENAAEADGGDNRVSEGNVLISDNEEGGKEL